MMLRASIAAAANRGGNEAEKQYPWPERRWEDTSEKHKCIPPSLPPGPPSLSPLPHSFHSL